MPLPKAGADHNKDDFAEWSDVLGLKRHRVQGRAVSTADALLIKQYERALEGDAKAIKLMVKMLKKNSAERSRRRALYDEREDPVAMRRLRARNREERHADPAMLLLGIAVVDNLGVKSLGTPGEPTYDQQVASLRPTHLASWVVEFAQDIKSIPWRSDDDWRRARWRTFDQDSAFCRLWYEQKAAILGRMVELRGPAGARFRAGRCPNPRGRPRQPKKECAPYPYDGFFMEPVSMEYEGKKLVFSRLDALMLVLVSKALKGDEDIEEIIAPVVAELKQLGWEAPPVQLFFEGEKG